jgi:hypothetical protein
LASRAASAFTASVEFVRWNGSIAPGFVSEGRSSFVNPTMATVTPCLNLNVYDGDHSLGVFPLTSTRFDETNGKFARGINCVRMKSALRSKLWFPRPSMSMPIMFMTSIVGRSSKNAEIGGVAPTESPADISITPACLSLNAASASYVSKYFLRYAAPPIGNAAFTPGDARLSAVSVSGISWPW